MVRELKVLGEQFCNLAALVAPELFIFQNSSDIGYPQRSASNEQQGGSTITF